MMSMISIVQYNIENNKYISERFLPEAGRKMVVHPSKIYYDQTPNIEVLK